MGGMTEPGAQNPYLRDAVLTATPEQLQLMLYDGAIRFATQGRDAIEKRDFETAYERLTRAQHVVLEMHSGLNHEVNAELCARMAGLYMFIYRRLIDANVSHDVDAVDDALKILRLERETWKMVVDKVAAERAGDADETDPTSECQAAAGTLSVEG